MFEAVELFPRIPCQKAVNMEGPDVAEMIEPEKLAVEQTGEGQGQSLAAGAEEVPALPLPEGGLDRKLALFSCRAPKH